MLTCNIYPSKHTHTHAIFNLSFLRDTYKVLMQIPLISFEPRIQFCTAPCASGLEHSYPWHPWQQVPVNTTSSSLFFCCDVYVGFPLQSICLAFLPTDVRALHIQFYILTVLTHFCFTKDSI